MPRPERYVAVTGVGMVTPIGTGVATNWQQRLRPQNCARPAPVRVALSNFLPLRRRQYLPGVPRVPSAVTAGRAVVARGALVRRRMPYVSLGMFVAAAFTRVRLYQLADRFRPASSARALATLARWCRWACPRLGLQVQVEGAVLNGSCLYVSNHRTYLDIPVLTSVLGATFLSRADVVTWPLVGTLARLTDTVLVERDDPRDRLRAARALMRRLRTSSVVVFPEGTTTGALLPASFHPGPFRLVQRLEVPVVPVTVRYSDRRAYWVDELTTWQHLTTRVLNGAPLRVTVHIGSPLHSSDCTDVGQLAAAIYAAVCRPIEMYGELV